jgi:hypothetical protein
LWLFGGDFAFSETMSVASMNDLWRFAMPE